MENPILNSVQPTFVPAYEPAAVTQNFAAYTPSRGASVIVIGAGAFGGWTALYLLRAGFRVTLLDAWGGGNSRSSSGDETRVIRSTYGGNALYFDLNIRALELWKSHQRDWGLQLFFPAGVLWFCYRENEPMIEESRPFMRRHGLEYQYLLPGEARVRYPHIHVDDLSHLVLDPYGGYLKAREGAIAVQEAFIREGGTYLQALAKPGKIHHQRMENIELEDGSLLEGDTFVFACGSWLRQVFPEALGGFIHCTRQEAYYLGVPSRYAKHFDEMPVWVDADGADFYYGIPGNARRGFKVGVDRRGAAFDPTQDERILNPEVLDHARSFMTHRFPVLKNAPLIENRVCHYGNTSDGNFLLDLHPDAQNCWMMGGGSGHGYKHGPALGEKAAGIIAGQLPLEPAFLLAR